MKKVVKALGISFMMVLLLAGCMNSPGNSSAKAEKELKEICDAIVVMDLQKVASITGEDFAEIEEDENFQIGKIYMEAMAEKCSYKILNIEKTQADGKESYIYEMEIKQVNIDELIKDITNVKSYISTNIESLINMGNDEEANLEFTKSILTELAKDIKAYKGETVTKTVKIEMYSEDGWKTYDVKNIEEFIEVCYAQDGLDKIMAEFTEIMMAEFLEA